MTSDVEVRQGFVDAGDADEYLKSLNLCFPEWGGRERFDWAFTRVGAGLSPDIIQWRLAGRPLAGTAVNYRRVRLANGEGVTVGIMTASWTLPEARGRGAFSQLIHLSRDLASTRGAALLLAFVKEANASFRRLQAAGAALFRSSYCRYGWHDGNAAANDVQTLKPETFPVQKLERTTCFVYDGDEWRQQFIDRPGPVECVGVVDRWMALIEVTQAFDRILTLVMKEGSSRPDALNALACRAAIHGRELFWFATTDAETEVPESRLSRVSGYVTALIANDAAFARACGTSNSSAARQIGPWRIEHGDQM